MDPVLIAVFTVGAFVNVYTAYCCFQPRVRRLLGSFTPFVIFQLCLNLGTYGALLSVSKSQDSVSRNFTAACIAGPTVAYFSVSILIFSNTAWMFVNYIRRIYGWRFSTKQALLIVAVALFQSCLLLSPAIRIAAAKNTAVITTKKCLDSARIASDQVIDVKVYVWWFHFFQFYVPGVTFMVVLSGEVMVYIRQVNVFTRCQSYHRVYTTLTNLLVLLLLVVLGGLPLYTTEQLEVPNYVLLKSEMSSLLVLLYPFQLMFLIELEITEEAGRQAKSGGRLIEDKATYYIDVNENNYTQDV